MKKKTRLWALGLVVAVLTSLFTGCGLLEEDEEVDPVTTMIESVENAIAGAGSVETSIFLELQAHIGSAGTTTSHSASVQTDMTVRATFAPYAFHTETFSRILVDNTSTREDTETYVVPLDNGYFEFSYNVETDEWTQQKLTQAEALALPLKTCLLQDWDAFFRVANLDGEGVDCNHKITNMYTAEMSASVLQEVFPDGIFGSFLYSMEQLLEDKVHCSVYIDQTTFLPVQMVLDFQEAFTVSDMNFDNAIITVDYDEWGGVGEISVPKKVSVVASDPTAEFYASYFAWNLFLPYLQGNTDNNDNPGGDVGFISTWENFQIRIDGRVTALPIPYADLTNLGYIIDDYYNTIIIEPNKYVSDVPVRKGGDVVYCTFYNDQTYAQPITACKIGCFDIKKADQAQNGIVVYLPGNICLGVTKEFLVSTYGTPHELISNFACDTLIWRIQDTENQWFMAEISPTTGQVIRLQLVYIPVTGGQQ